MIPLFESRYKETGQTRRVRIGEGVKCPWRASDTFLVEDYDKSLFPGDNMMSLVDILTRSSTGCVAVVKECLGNLVMWYCPIMVCSGSRKEIRFASI